MNCYVLHLLGPYKKAITSAAGIFDNFIISDNSLKLNEPLYNVIRPPFYLHMTQILNWIFLNNTDDHFCIMHDDAEILDKEVIQRWIANTVASKEPWAISETCGQCLAMFNKKAIDIIGGYDTNFFDYFSDFDYLVRLRHAGFVILRDPEAYKAVSHVCSSVQLASAKRKIETFEHTFPYAKNYFQAKWGSVNVPFEKPFNGRLL